MKTDLITADIQPLNDLPDPSSHKWQVLIAIAVGHMMATMDASITNIAFPVLTKTFRTDLTTVMWVTVAFILVSTCSMLIVGKISDIIGRKKIYVAGVAVFTLGLLACALAASINQLIFFRTLQAIGAAMSVSSGTAIVTETFPPHEMGKGLGFLGVSVSVGFIAGPILGGLFLDWMDWRSIFYLRIPLSLAAFLMAIMLLQRDRINPSEIKLDLLGTLTSSAGIFLFVLGVSQIRTYGFASLLVHFLIGFGLFLIVLFVLIERRARDPIVDLSLFKDSVFSSTIWGLFISFIAAPPYVLIMPFYLIMALHLDPSVAGLLMAATSMTTIVSGPIGGWLSDRFGPIWFAAGGAAATAVAFFLMLGFGLQTEMGTIVLVLILLGIGVGTFNPSNNSIIMGSVSREHLGSASALIATQRQVGMAIGMAVAGTLFSAGRDSHYQILTQKGIEANHATDLAIPLAFHDVLLISAFLNVIVVILCLFPVWSKRRRIAMA